MPVYVRDKFARVAVHREGGGVYIGIDGRIPGDKPKRMGPMQYHLSPAAAREVARLLYVAADLAEEPGDGAKGGVSR